MVIKLNVTTRSKSIPDEVFNKIYDYSDGVMIYPVRDDFPMPWDAVCYIEDNFFIIDGDLGQQGSNRSWAKVGIPLDKVKNYLRLEIAPDEEEFEEELTNIFKEYGWI